MTKPLRVLQILSSLNCSNGIAQVVLNWHRNIDRSKIQFDYLLYWEQSGPNALEEEAKSLGGNIYHITYRGYKYAIPFLFSLRNFFKQHHYPVIHSHVTNLNFIYYPLAKLYGQSVLIQHIHSVKWSNHKKGAIRNFLLSHMVWPLVSYKLSCSEEAGRSCYKKNYLVLKNGIDIAKYQRNENIRQQKRKELNLEPYFVVGHIGRFEVEKNHLFLIDIFEEIKNKRQNSVLLLIGEGHQKEHIQRYINHKRLQDSVFLLNPRNDIADILQVMDVFIFPSLYEGLGMAAIEAQANGLPVLASDKIPQETLVTNFYRLSLSTSPATWAKTALAAKRNSNTSEVYTKLAPDFDGYKNTQKLQDLYLSIITTRNIQKWI